MSKRLHLDPKAEQEANEVASRFMNSSDVVGDMSRAYGRDLSSVRIHADENAAQKVARGRRLLHRQGHLLRPGGL